MKTIRHNHLPNGSYNGGMGYKIKTAALKNQLEKIKQDFPDREWIIEQNWVTTAYWVAGDGYKVYYIAEVVGA